MKSCLWLAFLSLTAVAYGAVVGPAAPVQRPLLSEDAEDDVVEKAGKTLETVGRILQGKNVDPTEENPQNVLDVLQALTAGEGAEGLQAAEYFLPIIMRGVNKGLKNAHDKIKG